MVYLQHTLFNSDLNVTWRSSKGTFKSCQDISLSLVSQFICFPYWEENVMLEDVCDCFISALVAPKHLYLLPLLCSTIFCCICTYLCNNAYCSQAVFTHSHSHCKAVLLHYTHHEPQLPSHSLTQKQTIK